MGPDGATADLERCFIMTMRKRVALPELRAAVCAFTDERRAAGEPIERVLVNLKEAITRAKTASWVRFHHTGEVPVVDDLTSVVVLCAIEQFFRASERPLRSGESNATQ
jgi:hypothetical protein